MDIADLQQAKAGEGRGQTGDADGPLDDLNFMARDLAGVKGEPGGGKGRKAQKTAAVEKLRQKAPDGSIPRRGYGFGLSHCLQFSGQL